MLSLCIYASSQEGFGVITMCFSGRILKANLNWSPTWAKFYQLIASLSVILPQLNETKLKLEYLKSGFKCKKER